MTGVDLTEETIFTWMSLTAPGAFRFSFPSAPGRHLAAAALLALDGNKLHDPSEQLPPAAVDLTRDIEIPDGIRAAGHTKANITGLVPGTMKQQRLLATCPPSVGAGETTAIVGRSTESW